MSRVSQQDIERIIYLTLTCNAETTSVADEVHRSKGLVCAVKGIAQAIIKQDWDEVIRRASISSYTTYIYPCAAALHASFPTEVQAEINATLAKTSEARRKPKSYRPAVEHLDQIAGNQLSIEEDISASKQPPSPSSEMSPEYKWMDAIASALGVLIETQSQILAAIRSMDDNQNVNFDALYRVFKDQTESIKTTIKKTGKPQS